MAVCLKPPILLLSVNVFICALGYKHKNAMVLLFITDKKLPTTQMSKDGKK
jgi:hypothetical protein